MREVQPGSDRKGDAPGNGAGASPSEERQNDAAPRSAGTAGRGAFEWSRELTVSGTGERYGWGRRDDAFVIWQLGPPWKVVESFSLPQHLEAFLRFKELESQRPGQLRVRTRAVPRLALGVSTLAAGILVLAFGVVMYLTVVRGGSGDPSNPLAPSERGAASVSPAPAIPSPAGQIVPPGSSLPGINVHVNDRAGYLFSYPDGWELSRSGGSDELISPEGDVVMSFGVAPSGSLRRTSDHIVGSLTDTYADVRLIAGDVERTDQGRPSMVVGGRATDVNGALIRFLAIAIRGPDQNRAITVQFSDGSAPLDALPAIQEIVASFRTSEVA